MLCLPELLYSVTLTLRHATVDPYLCGDSWTLFNRMKQVRKRKTNIVCWRTYMEPRDFLSGSDSKESACSAGDPGLILGSGRFPWRKEWQSTLVFLPEEFHGQRNLARYNPCGRKESDMTDWATHTCTHTYTHTHTYKQNLEKWYWWTYLQSNTQDTGIWLRLVDTIGGWESGTNWENNPETYVFSCTK